MKIMQTHEGDRFDVNMHSGDMICRLIYKHSSDMICRVIRGIYAQY